jgi:phage tail protein X
MKARFPHPAGLGGTDSGAVGHGLHDDTIDSRTSVSLGPACCCPGRPVVQVIMPATTTRPHRTELLLCGHHYRASRQALAAANAVVTALPGLADDPPAALPLGLPIPRVPVN